MASAVAVSNNLSLHLEGVVGIERRKLFPQITFLHSYHWKTSLSKFRNVWKVISVEYTNQAALIKEKKASLYFTLK